MQAAGRGVEIGGDVGFALMGKYVRRFITTSCDYEVATTIVG
jgi:hypothetical protein